MNPLLDLSLRVALAYLLGSVLGSMLVGRLRGGVDIRTLGSGNAGGTNALRTQGKLFGVLVLSIDFVKGWLATTWVSSVQWPGTGAASGSVFAAWLPALCATAAVLGHVYPLWYGFRGGKGIATGAGAMVGLSALLLVPALLLWIAMVLLTGFVGLASICAAFALPLATLLLRPEPFAPLLAFTSVAAALVVYTHRGNIRRMRAGTESRSKLRRRNPRSVT
jgi:acyl phosphate:glycerol-3-phosphate acyltransferase